MIFVIIDSIHGLLDNYKGVEITSPGTKTHPFFFVPEQVREKGILCGCGSQQRQPDVLLDRATVDVRFNRFLHGKTNRPNGL